MFGIACFALHCTCVALLHFCCTLVLVLHSLSLLLRLQSCVALLHVMLLHLRQDEVLDLNSAWCDACTAVRFIISCVPLPSNIAPAMKSMKAGGAMTATGHVSFFFVAVVLK